MLVALALPYRHELLGKAPRGIGGRPATLALERERVLVGAAHAPALGDVLPGLPHALQWEELGHARVGEAPAERRVVERAVAAGERLCVLAHDERGAAHRFDATGHHQLGFARANRLAGADDSGEPRRAQPVDRHSRDLLGQPGEQQRHASHVAIVLAGLVGAAEVDLLDRGRVEAGQALDGAAQRDRGEIVRSDVRERASVAPHGGAHGGEDHGVGRRCHGLKLSDRWSAGTAGRGPSGEPRRGPAARR